MATGNALIFALFIALAVFIIYKIGQWNAKK